MIPIAWGTSIEPSGFGEAAAESMFVTPAMCLALISARLLRRSSIIAASSIGLKSTFKLVASPFVVTWAEVLSIL